VSVRVATSIAPPSDDLPPIPVAVLAIVMLIVLGKSIAAFAGVVLARSA